MPEEILFEVEKSMSRPDAAAYLHAVAEKLETSGTLQFTAGEKSRAVEVPEHLEFEVKVEREPSQGGAKIGVEFELEWKEGTEAASTSHLKIE